MQIHVKRKCTGESARTHTRPEKRKREKYYTYSHGQQAGVWIGRSQPQSRRPPLLPTPPPGACARPSPPAAPGRAPCRRGCQPPGRRPGSPGPGVEWRSRRRVCTAAAGPASTWWAVGGRSAPPGVLRMPVVITARPAVQPLCAPGPCRIPTTCKWKVVKKKVKLRPRKVRARRTIRALFRWVVARELDSEDGVQCPSHAARGPSRQQPV